MEKEASCAVRPHCSFSSTENLCRILDDAGVPDDPHWRSFILYARNLNDHNYLTHRQRARMQSMVLRVLQENDFPTQNSISCWKKTIASSAPHTGSSCKGRSRNRKACCGSSPPFCTAAEGISAISATRLSRRSKKAPSRKR